MRADTVFLQSHAYRLVDPGTDGFFVDDLGGAHELGNRVVVLKRKWPSVGVEPLMSRLRGQRTCEHQGREADKCH